MQILNCTKSSLCIEKPVYAIARVDNVAHRWLLVNLCFAKPQCFGGKLPQELISHVAAKSFQNGKELMPDINKPSPARFASPMLH